MVHRILRRFARYVDGRMTGLFRRFDAWSLPDFANIPKRLNLPAPRVLVNSHLISIGDDCRLGRVATIAAITEYRDGGNQKFSPRITIGDRVWATAHLQVFAACEITIEDDVMIAANVFIFDHSHGMGRADIPYRRQPLERIAPVRIGKGSWLGQNVVVMPGVTIGEFAIVGANSVVTRSIPPRSIAVGSPARVLRAWDSTSDQWAAADMLSSR